MDSQATLGNGVVVQVTGELSNGGQPMRRFTQTFVLAAQSPKQYYVHNDIFRYQVCGYRDVLIFYFELFACMHCFVSLCRILSSPRKIQSGVIRGVKNPHPNNHHLPLYPPLTSHLLLQLPQHLFLLPPPIPLQSLPNLPIQITHLTTDIRMIFKVSKTL